MKRSIGWGVRWRGMCISIIFNFDGQWVRGWGGLTQCTYTNMDRWVWSVRRHGSAGRVPGDVQSIWSNFSCPLIQTYMLLGRGSRHWEVKSFFWMMMEQAWRYNQIKIPFLPLHYRHSSSSSSSSVPQKTLNLKAEWITSPNCYWTSVTRLFRPDLGLDFNYLLEFLFSKIQKRTVLKRKPPKLVWCFWCFTTYQLAQDRVTSHFTSSWTEWVEITDFIRIVHWCVRYLWSDKFDFSSVIAIHGCYFIWPLHFLSLRDNDLLEAKNWEPEVYSLHS